MESADELKIHEKDETALSDRLLGLRLRRKHFRSSANSADQGILFLLPPIGRLIRLSLIGRFTSATICGFNRSFI